MYPPANPNLNYETDDTIYFFTWAFYPLDNYSAHQVEIWWQTFATVEHAYQWKKFAGSASHVAEVIKAAKSPEQVKNVSIEHNKLTPADWSTKRVSVMREILFAKTQQHEDVFDMLLKIQTKRIVENSPIDSFWGVWPDGRGENMIGKIWEEIREGLWNRYSASKKSGTGMKI